MDEPKLYLCFTHRTPSPEMEFDPVQGVLWQPGREHDSAGLTGNRNEVTQRRCGLSTLNSVDFRRADSFASLLLEDQTSG